LEETKKLIFDTRKNLADNLKIESKQVEAIVINNKLETEYEKKVKADDAKQRLFLFFL
jgi:hypothetical protein